MGCAVLAGLPLAECVLYTSGRVPLDMVRKAIRAGVPVLVSKVCPPCNPQSLQQNTACSWCAGAKSLKFKQILQNNSYKTEKPVCFC